jgi:hypothetical protein
LQFLIKKDTFVVIFFLQFLVIKTLDPDPEPDPDSLEMLDPDPDPQPLKELGHTLLPVSGFQLVQRSASSWQMTAKLSSNLGLKAGIPGE